jgi:hypothetical protein
MTQSDRERIMKILVGNIPVAAILDFCARETMLLEPVIDDIEKQAYLRGRFETLLEYAYAEQQGRLVLIPF